MIPRRRWALCLVSVFALGTSPPTQDGQEPSTTLYELAGLTVIHRMNPASDLVAVHLYLLGGARQLTPSTAGIEALLLRAAELETLRAMSQTGGYSVLEPGPDWTVVGFVGLKQEFDAMWSVLSERILVPPQDTAAIDRARNELRVAARRRNSQPDLRINALAQRALFGDHPYGLHPLGTDRSLARLRVADLERYAAQQFVTSRMLLVVVGDVPRATLDSIIPATLGRLPRGEYEWTLPPPVPRRPTRWLVVQRQLPTNYVLGYFTGPDPSDDDYFAFQVATRVLSSRLQQIVREERSLSYATYAPFLDWAVPIGGFYASSPDPGQAFNLIIDQIEWLQTLGGGYRWWGRYKDQFTLDQLALQLTSEGEADALARAHLFFGDHTIADSYADRLRGVSLRQVRQIARNYMRQVQYAFLGDTVLMRGKW